jgi:hypothetical protein
LKLPELLQVGELKQFLQKKLQFPEELYRRMEILIPSALNQQPTVSSSSSSSNAAAVAQSPPVEKWIVLDECLTMSDIVMLYWNAKAELLLYFRLSPHSSFASSSDYQEEGLIVNHHRSHSHHREGIDQNNAEMNSSQDVLVK